MYTDNNVLGTDIIAILSVIGSSYSCHQVPKRTSFWAIVRSLISYIRVNAVAQHPSSTDCDPTSHTRRQAPFSRRALRTSTTFVNHDRIAPPRQGFVDSGEAADLDYFDQERVHQALGYTEICWLPVHVVVKSVSSSLRYSPTSACRNTVMPVGSSLRASAVDLAVTPKPYITHKSVIAFG